MIDFLSQYPMYVVLACALVIWAGIATYLWRVDARLAELERKMER